jgi:serine/threonine protein kinase
MHNYPAMHINILSSPRFKTSPSICPRTISFHHIPIPNASRSKTNRSTVTTRLPPPNKQKSNVLSKKFHHSQMEEVCERFPAFSSFRICGRGSVSTVYYACHTRTQFPVSVKQIHKSRLSDVLGERQFDFELSMLRRLDHPFICRCFWVDETSDSYFLLNEYCPNGTLLSHLNRGKPSMSELLRIFCQLVCAVYFLHHHRNLVHRDIKIENILFDEFMNVRLIDFGFSKTLSEGHSQLRTVCGSYPYCAPEVFQGVPYGKPVDVWSVGTKMNSGHFAFVNGSRSHVKIFKAIQKVRR